MTNDLQQLRLCEQGVRIVAMEATGVYRAPAGPIFDIMQEVASLALTSTVSPACQLRFPRV